MLRNYLVVTLRAFRKHTLYSFLNVFGLSLGLTVAFLIALYVIFDFSFDRFHEKADRTYRITQQQQENFFLGSNKFAVSPGPVGDALQSELSYVEQTAQVGRLPGLVSTGSQGFYEDGIFATPSFFSVFDFVLLQGDASDVLEVPNSVVVTTSFASKLFGATNPIGQRITITHFNTPYDLNVTGVVADPPPNSHLDFSFVVSYAGNPSFENAVWGNNSYHTYAVLRPGASEETFAKDLRAIVERNMLELDWINDRSDIARFFPMRLVDLHLRSEANFELGTPGNERYLWLLVLAAGVILITACINYINLATARATTRSKEVGVRKVAGADKSQLVKQFLGESIVTASIASVLAIGLTLFLLPSFNNLIAREIPESLVLSFRFVVATLAIGVSVGLLSGLYPALALSRMTPISVLKSGIRTRSSKSVLRNTLVVSQFAIAIIFVASTFIIKQQLAYIRSSDTGVDRDLVLTVTVRDSELPGRWSTLRSELAALPGILAVSSAAYLPIDIGSSSGVDDWDGREGNAELQIYNSSVNYGYEGLLGLKIVEGRGFSEEHASDEGSGLVINETAKRMLGWDTAVGKRLDMGGRGNEVIGVVEDFQFHSSHLDISPLALYVDPDGIRKLLLKVRPEELARTVSSVGAIMKTFSPKYPYEYQFLDDAFNSMYQAEQRLSVVFVVITALALAIACLGLFGLAAFMALQRTKEIGVRKALGASLNDIILLLSRDFGRLIVIAFLVGSPIAYFMMQRWLNQFAFHVDISAMVFLATGLLIAAVTLLTVGYHSVKASLADPVEALRYE